MIFPSRMAGLQESSSNIISVMNTINGIDAEDKAASIGTQPLFFYLSAFTIAK
jgi:hypothetical protein